MGSIIGHWIDYLTIIPGARICSESIAYLEAMMARRIIVLVKSNQLVKNTENEKFLAS